MDYFFGKTIEPVLFVGRSVQKCVGADAAYKSENLTFGFSHFAPELGIMQPHQHGEEIIHIVACEQGVVRFGSSAECLEGRVEMEVGMSMRFHEGEWHVFEFPNHTGFADFLFFYGDVKNVRPDKEIIKENK